MDPSSIADGLFSLVFQYGVVGVLIAFGVKLVINEFVGPRPRPSYEPPPRQRPRLRLVPTPPKPGTPTKTSSEDAVLSGVVAYETDSAIAGLLVGGSLHGAIIGKEVADLTKPAELPTGGSDSSSNQDFSGGDAGGGGGPTC